MASSWPRTTSSWWTPARLMAARCRDGPPRPAGRGSAASARGRARRAAAIPPRRRRAGCPDVTEPVTTVPWPCTMKERSMARRNHSLPRAFLDLPAGVGDGRLQFRRCPAPVWAEVRDDRRVLQEGALDQLADFQLDDLARRFVDQVALGQGDDAVAQAEQAEDFQVLARLRHDRIVGGDDQHGQVDAGGAGEHVLDEALVAGHVDDAEAVSRPGRGWRSRCRW